ncbi:hypothetical protein [Crenalkalicoccus roseus]|uniref:hypothetical protein n=1 Tax=Crenalkalicoccus roseus TaxID=1485588 RepID=UPI001080BD51|nr:hypothetical protein [Crenalkalicoccus roseus]
MAIEANSEGWTGQHTEPVAPQVCGEFHSKDKLDEALSRLEGSYFQHADLSIRIPKREDPSATSTEEEPLREDEVRNLRQLGIGISTYLVAAVAGGAAVVATGGAMLPAVAAAAAAGGATAAAGTAVGQSVAPGGEAEHHQAAETTGVILMVHADTPERQAKAEELLRACGATRVWIQGSAAETRTG